MKKIIRWSRASDKAAGITFRILFVSPFFELEVRNGMQKWQSVRSQVLIVNPATENTQQSAYYPMLHFRSYTKAEEYAIETLGLHQRTTWWSLLWAAPPASFEHTTPRYDFAAGEPQGQVQATLEDVRDGGSFSPEEFRAMQFAYYTELEHGTGIKT